MVLYINPLEDYIWGRGKDFFYSYIAAKKAKINLETTKVRLFSSYGAASSTLKYSDGKEISIILYENIPIGDLGECEVCINGVRLAMYYPSSRTLSLRFLPKEIFNTLDLDVYLEFMQEFFCTVKKVAFHRTRASIIEMLKNILKERRTTSESVEAQLVNKLAEVEAERERLLCSLSDIRRARAILPKLADIVIEGNILEGLISSGNLESYVITGSGEGRAFKFYTGPIEVLDVELGKFEIHIPVNFKAGNIRIYGDGTHSINGYGHPHVDPGGIPCFGSGGPIIRTLMQDAKIGQVVLFLIEFLKSYNADNPFIKLSAWGSSVEADEFEDCRENSSHSDCAQCSNSRCPYSDGAGEACFEEITAYGDVLNCIQCRGCSWFEQAEDFCKETHSTRECRDCSVRECRYNDISDEDCRETAGIEDCTGCTYDCKFAVPSTYEYVSWNISSVAETSPSILVKAAEELGIEGPWIDFLGSELMLSGYVDPDKDTEALKTEFLQKMTIAPSPQK